MVVNQFIIFTILFRFLNPMIIFYFSFSPIIALGFDDFTEPKITNDHFKKPPFKTLEDIYGERLDLIELGRKEDRVIIAVFDTGVDYNDPRLAFRLVQKLDDQKRLSVMNELEILKSNLDIQEENVSKYLSSAESKLRLKVSFDFYNSKRKKVEKLRNQIKNRIFSINQVLQEGARGYDCIDKDQLPYAVPNKNVYEMHGTIVSSIAADGVETAILPMRYITGKFDPTRPESLLNGFNYAVLFGAKVINLSFGIGIIHGKSQWRWLKRDSAADDEAEKAKHVIEVYRNIFRRFPDTIFVVAAGNEGFGPSTILKSSPSTFADLNEPNVIVVGANNEFGEKSSFSNYGKSKVHLSSAFGETDLEFKISKPNNNGFSLDKSDIHGTSFSAPDVSHALGRIFYHNSNASVEDAIKMLHQQFVTKTNSLTKEFKWGGYLDQEKIVQSFGEIKISNGKQKCINALSSQFNLSH